MTLGKLLIATATLGTILGLRAAPAAAQYYPQYPQYPQPYPQQAYPYGYNQPYTGNPVVDTIDQLLGNRYSVNDRQAVRQCANAARNQALGQYGTYGRGYGGYGNRYNNQAWASSLRVTAITSVERRTFGLRVNGMLGSGAYPNQYGQYGGQYGYQNNYAVGELSFRCNVDYRGVVTDIRVRPR